MKKAVSFKIADESLADLRKLAKKEKSQAVVIEKGIELYKQANKDHQMRLSELYTLLCENIAVLDADPDHDHEGGLYDQYVEIKKQLEGSGLLS